MADTPTEKLRVTRRAVIIWLAGCAVYIMAVAGRTSFGVAGVAAIDRFHIDASQLALFTTVQLTVYALAQVPNGIAIDRVGPKRMLLFGAVVMAIGQIILGLASNLWAALVARVLIGMGDATAFLSVLRLLPQWFPLKKAPIFAQITGAMGQIGQLISAIPFLALLGMAGWTIAFVGLGAVGIITAAAAFFIVSDSPTSSRPRTSEAHMPLPWALRRVILDPIVWQAFFTHWSNMVLLNTFLLLWGMPLMTLSMGIDAATAGVAFTVAALSSVLGGPIHGLISTRLGRRRELFALAVALIAGVSTLILFASTSPRSIGAVILWVVIAALTIPASGYGFDSIRETVAIPIMATATGFANMGGFLATIIASQLLGVVLDQITTSNPYAWSDFQSAWLAPLVVWGVGVIGLGFSLLKVRSLRKHQLSAR